MANPYCIYADLETFTGKNSYKVTAAAYKVVAHHPIRTHRTSTCVSSRVPAVCFECCNS